MAQFQGLLNFITTGINWVTTSVPYFLSLNKTKVLAKDEIRRDITEVGAEERTEAITSIRNKYDDIAVNPTLQEKQQDSGFFSRLKGGISKTIDYCISNTTVRLAVLLISLGTAFINPFGLAVGLAMFGVTAALTVTQFIVEGYQLRNLRKLQNDNEAVKEIAEVHADLHRDLLMNPELQHLLVTHKDKALRGIGDIRIDPKSLEANAMPGNYNMPNIGQHSHSGAKSVMKGLGDMACDTAVTAMGIAKMALVGTSPFILIPTIASCVLDQGVSISTRKVRDQENVKLKNNLERSKALYDLDFTNGQGLDYLNKTLVYRKLELEATREVRDKLPEIRNNAVQEVLTKLDANKEQITNIQNKITALTQLEKQLALAKIETDNLNDAINLKNSKSYKDNIGVLEIKLAALQQEKHDLSQKEGQTKKAQAKLDKQNKQLDKKITALEAEINQGIKEISLTTNISHKYYHESPEKLQQGLEKVKENRATLESQIDSIKGSKQNINGHDLPTILSQISEKVEQNIRIEFDEALDKKLLDQTSINAKIDSYKPLHNPKKGVLATSLEVAQTFSYSETNAKIFPGFRLTDHRHYITGKVGLDTAKMSQEITVSDRLGQVLPEQGQANNTKLEVEQSSIKPNGREENSRLTDLEQGEQGSSLVTNIEEKINTASSLKDSVLEIQHTAEKFSKLDNEVMQSHSSEQSTHASRHSKKTNTSIEAIKDSEANKIKPKKKDRLAKKDPDSAEVSRSPTISL